MAGTIEVVDLTFNWSQGNTILSIVLTAPGTLAVSTQYKLELLKGFKSKGGYKADETFELMFETAAIAPNPVTFAVTGVNPPDTTAGLPQFTPRHSTVTFNDQVDPSTITNDNFYLAPIAGGDNISADLFISLNLRSVTLVTKKDLTINTGYTLTVNTSVTSNRVPAVPLAADFTATFSTGEFTTQLSNSSIKIFNGKVSNTAGTMKSDVSGDYTKKDNTTSDNFSADGK